MLSLHGSIKAFSFSLCWRFLLLLTLSLCPHALCAVETLQGWCLPPGQQYGQWLMHTEDSWVFNSYLHSPCVVILALHVGCTCLSPPWGEVSILMPRGFASPFLHTTPNGSVKKGSWQVLPLPCCLSSTSTGNTQSTGRTVWYKISLCGTPQVLVTLLIFLQWDPGMGELWPQARCKLALVGTGQRQGQCRSVTAVSKVLPHAL